MQLPQFDRLAAVRAESFDADSNTIEIVWTTGASVRRYDWWDGTEYDEVLSVDPKAIRLERLNLGAPFLDSHCSYGCDNVIGAVVPGSAKIEDGRGVARIQLSKAPGVADTVQKIREGVIRNVSVGYWVHKVEKTEADDGTVARWDVVDWEPLEISAVPIPADAASQIRSDQAEGDGPKLRACLVVTRNPASGPPPKARGDKSMAGKTTKPKSQRAKTPAELEAEKKRLAAARSAAARKAAARAAREDESDTDEDADGDAERDEEMDEERDGDDGEDGDAGSDDERDGDDDAEDDEDRDGDDDEDDGDGERAAPKPAKRKALTAAEVRKAAEVAVRADRVRGAKIREIAKQFGFPNLGERHANGETSVRAFKDLVLERLAERQKKRGNTTFAAASAAGVGEEYRGAVPAARDFDKGAAEARALLGKK